MRLCLCVSLLLLCSSFSSLTAQKQDEKALLLLENARAISLGNANNLPPYRLEASFETFDEKGQTDGRGTVVQTELPNGLLKRVITFRGKTVETVRSGQWHSVADEGYLETFLQRHLLDALINPVPPAAQYKVGALTVRSLKSGTTQMQCAIVSIPLPNEQDSHAVAPSNAYCVDSDLGILREIIGHNNYNVILNKFRKLQNTYLPGDVAIMQGNIKRGQLHLDRFAVDNSLNAADFSVPELKAGMMDPTRSKVDHDAVAATIVKKTQPKYPEVATRNHISGRVTLNAIIGKDGTIRDLELLTAPDDSLAQAAMDAVKTWEYKPYFHDGKPAEVETTITVMFFLTRQRPQ